MRNLLISAILISLFNFSCNEEITDADQLYEDGQLREDVYVKEWHREIEGRRYLEKKYFLDSAWVMDEYMHLPDSYLSYRRFFLGHSMKRVDYFAQLDSVGKLKFEGDVSKIQIKGRGKPHLMEEQEWYRKGYIEAKPDEKYFWNRWIQTKQLKQEGRRETGKRPSGSSWFNNGQLRYSSYEDTIIADSIIKRTHWHKNGTKNEVVVDSHKKGEGQKRKLVWNGNGRLISDYDHDKRISTSWNDDGSLQHVTIRFDKSGTGIDSVINYTDNQIYSIAIFIDGKKVREEKLQGPYYHDSSNFYLDSAWQLERSFDREKDNVELLYENLEFCYNKSIQFDSTNIYAYWKRFGLYGNDFAPRRKIIEPLWRLDSNLFDCSQSLQYGNFLLYDKEYKRAIEVFSLAIDRWENNLRELHIVYERRAIAYYAIQDYSSACADFNRVIEYKFYFDDWGRRDLEQLKEKYSTYLKYCE